MKPKLAIDIDEVLAEFAKTYMDYLKRKGHRTIPFEDIKKYQLWDYLDIPREQAYKYSLELLGLEESKKMPLVPGARESVQKLAEFFDLIFITARNLDFKEVTYSFIKEQIGIQDPLIYFSGDDYYKKNSSKTKLAICEDLGISYIVEDNPDFLQNHSQSPVIILLLEKPWNKAFTGKNIISCKNWEEVLFYLMERHG